MQRPFLILLAIVLFTHFNAFSQSADQLQQQRDLLWQHDDRITPGYVEKWKQQAKRRQQMAIPKAGAFSPVPAATLLAQPRPLPGAPRPQGNYQDTSLRLTFRKPGKWFTNDPITKTADGNILIPGFDYDTIGYVQAGHLLKCTQQGDAIWYKVIKGGFSGKTFNVYRAFELADHSILLAGEMAIPMPVNGRDDPMLIRLTANGDLMWQKTFETRMWSQDTTSGSMDIVNAKQDVNGDIFIGGSIRIYGMARLTLAVRMDPAGNVKWSTCASGVCAGIDLDANKFTVFGRTNFSSSINILAMELDKNTGDTLRTVAWQPTDPDIWRNFYPTEVTKLFNGGYALAGFGFSDSYIYDSTQLHTNGGFIELSPALDFVRCNLLKSAYAFYGYITRLNVFPDGSAAFSRLGWTSGTDQKIIYGTFKNGQLTKQRRVPYPDTKFSWQGNFLPMDDGGQICTNFLAEEATTSAYTEFIRLHNSDTSGSCLGNDTLAVMIDTKPQYERMQLYFDSIVHNVFTENQHPFQGVYADKFTVLSNCKQVSFCDSLKLVADKTIVCVGNPVTITVRKNTECGALPNWVFDATAVALQQVNDSTFTATVNGPWQGSLLATIDACKTLADSVPLTVLPAPGPVDLGPDTVICPGNSILLNARKGYAEYKWQNGSTDSTLAVSVPGKYFVTVTDACGGIFSDSVLVQPHAAIPLEIGPDTSICKNNSIVISAPLDFINYQWSGTNISNNTLSTIVARPLTNGWYTLRAEKTTGCFATDSLFVTVTQVPAIQLGPDTSFCAGRAVTLNAGSGFTSYNWSTGASSQTITATAAGTYTVAATFNGCVARDTLQVLNVYPLPVFSLGRDTSLCTGQVLPLNFNLTQATYQWNNGSSLPQFVIAQPGLYWLQVTRQGCVTRDSIAVQFKPVPIIHLGNDTSLCENQPLLLNALNANATYLWQDGTTASDYRVTSAGTYAVKASLNGCSSADTIAITYRNIPTFTLGRDTLLCAGNQYVLTPAVNTAVTYLWQDGSTAPSYTVVNDGLYTLQVSNECGSFRDAVAVTTTVCNIVMPTAFTPNGDGLNDVFKVKFPFPLQRFRLMIYNRFGERVFETNNMSKGWDGTWHGKILAPAAYVWYIEYTSVNTSVRSLRGTVTLLR